MNNYLGSLLISTNLLTILVSVFISITIICECYGYFFRLIGLKLGKAALGYSIHVQFGTFGRIGNIVGATLLSYGIESNLIEVQRIAFYSILILITSLIFPSTTSITPSTILYNSPSNFITLFLIIVEKNNAK